MPSVDPRPETSPRPTSAAPAARSPRVHIAIAAFVAVVLATTLGLGLDRATESPAAPVALGAAIGVEARDLNATTIPTGPTSTKAKPATTTTTEDPGPLPDPMPADPYAPTPQVVLGQIEIPKLGVIGDLQEGITLTAINRGPGHWPGTPKPGDIGNMVIAGHRTTYTKPFNRLNELVAGDKVLFHMPTGTITYEVRGVIIVPAANVGIAAQTKTAHVATLFACHPLHSATQRIVAKLELLGPDGKPVDPEAALPPLDAGSNPITDTTVMVRNTGGSSTPPSDPLAGADG